MVTRTRKTGRPIGFYRMADGTRIDGVTKLKDGRWRVSGSEKVTFTEHDEARAIRRAQDLITKRAGNTKVLVPMPDAADAKATSVAIQKVINSGHTFVMRVPPGGGPIKMQKTFDTAEAWAYFAETVLNNPAYAAKRSGIECLAWLPDVKKPAPSPTLLEVGKFYYDRTDLSEKEASKCRTTWEEFTRAVGVSTLREITAEAVGAWGLKVRGKGLAPKTVSHTFHRIKTVLNNYRQTGRGLDDIRKALDCAAVLKAPETTSLDPHPIARADFHKLLEAAEGEGKAQLLVGLNLCMYPIDLARLRWSELDLARGVYHALRGKTKVARCGVLWARTIEALNGLSRREDAFVFHKDNGQPHTDTTIRKWFYNLRDAAKVEKEVQFADIRDGSFTEAVAGVGVEFQHAQVLAGHRSGIADAYVRRAPRMVAKACEAVEAAYFG